MVSVRISEPITGKVINNYLGELLVKNAKKPTLDAS